MRHDFKKLFLNTGIVISGGFVSAVFFILLASNRLRLINKESVNSLLLFVPLYNFVLLIAKQGIDQWVFAQSSSKTNAVFKLTHSIFTRIVVIDLLCAIYFGFNYDATIGVLVFISLLFDVTSLIKQSELLGHGQYKKATVLTLLNYPLFFFLIVCFTLRTPIEFNLIIILFALTSFIRWCAANLIIIKKAPSALIYYCDGSVTALLFIQIFNYLLFKSDQILASVSIFSAVHFSHNIIATGVYLWRFPDIFSSLFSYMGATLYPFVFINADRIIYILKKWIIVLVTVIVLLGVIFYFVVTRIWAGDYPLTAFCVAPFYISIVLNIPVNYFIYTMLRYENIYKLLLLIFLSNLSGFVLYLIMFTMYKIGYIYFWVVPLQLGILSITYYAFYSRVTK